MDLPYENQNWVSRERLQFVKPPKGGDYHLAADDIVKIVKKIKNVNISYNRTVNKDWESLSNMA